MKDLSRPASFLLALAELMSAVFIGAQEKIDINAAPAEELIKIVHIGEVRAEELISLRPFYSLDDLVKIKGVSEERVKDIKNQGLAWVSDQEELIEDKAQSIESGPIIVYPTNVVINEVLPSPAGQDSEEEWIEIQNQNSFAIDLFNWRLSDIEGRTTTYVFPREAALGQQEFFVLARPTSKIVLNNSKDGLRLIRPDGSLAHEMSYEAAETGQSLNLSDGGWFWSPVLTPGKENIIPRPEKEIASNKVLAALQPKALAGATSPLAEENEAAYRALALALSLSALFAAIILALKKFLKKGYNIKT